MLINALIWQPYCVVALVPVLWTQYLYSSLMYLYFWYLYLWYLYLVTKHLLQHLMTESSTQTHHIYEYIGHSQTKMQESSPTAWLVLMLHKSVTYLLRHLPTYSPGPTRDIQQLKVWNAVQRLKYWSTWTLQCTKPAHCNGTHSQLHVNLPRFHSHKLTTVLNYPR